MNHDTNSKLATGLAKIGLVIRHEAWRDAGSSGLTPTQSQTLVLLHHAPKVWMSVGDIARGIAITQPTASDAISTLEAKELVTRERLESDARVVCIRLTTDGRKQAKSHAGGPDVLLDAISELSDSEQDVFTRGLMKMIHSLQEAGRIPTSRMCASCSYFRPNVHNNAERPHHCALLDAPMRDSDLRLDCPEHEYVGEDRSERLWRLFVGGKPLPDH